MYADKTRKVKRLNYPTRGGTGKYIKHRPGIRKCGHENEQIEDQEIEFIPSYGQWDYHLDR